jgi:hypothetical protein
VDDLRIEETTDAEPMVAELQGELEAALSDFGTWKRQAKLNDDIRFCRWEGQSDDGRKWTENLSKEAFPWDGASDTRVRLADSIVNEQVMLMMRAFWNARVQALPVDSSDVAKGRLVTELMRWVIHTQLQRDLMREVPLAANWRQDKGCAVMGIFWRTDTELREQVVSLDELVVAAREDPAMAGLLEALMDENQEDGVVEAVMAMGLVQGVSKAAARKAIRELRTTGRAVLQVPGILASRPIWQALLPGVDVVFPKTTWDLQRARFVARRERLTETQLKERVVTDDYSEEFVKEVLEKRGQDPQDELEEEMRELSDGLGSVGGEVDRWVDIWHVYYRALTTKGVPTVYCTIVSRAVKDVVGKHERLPYAHGQYPFVELVRERLRRPILESRGVPEIVATTQQEIKVQRDFRSDRASISILPPFKYPANRGKIQMIMGPGRQLPVRKGEDGGYGWLNPPPNDGGTREVEESCRTDADEYFGIMTNWSRQMPVARQQMHQQHLVAGWLQEVKLCMEQTFQLMQQYMTPMEMVRITNADHVPLSADREEIQGRFDLMIEFDVRDLDTEYVMKKAQMISTVVAPMDVMGVLDRSRLVEFLMSWIDPGLARELVRSSEAASQAEIEDEQVQFAKMRAGIEPVTKESGQNFQLRLQEMQKMIAANPALQKRLMQPETEDDQVFRALVENRMKFLQFQVEQQQNAQIGRIGVKQVLGGNG